jgi:hypothetical protein
MTLTRQPGDEIATATVDIPPDSNPTTETDIALGAFPAGPGHNVKLRVTASSNAHINISSGAGEVQSLVQYRVDGGGWQTISARSSSASGVGNQSDSKTSGTTEVSLGEVADMSTIDVRVSVYCEVFGSGSADGDADITDWEIDHTVAVGMIIEA